MSLLRVAQLSRSSWTSTARKSVLTGLSSSLFQKRGYWWRRNSKDDEQNKGKEEEVDSASLQKDNAKPNNAARQTNIKAPYKRNIIRNSLVFNGDYADNGGTQVEFIDNPVEAEGPSPIGSLLKDFFKMQPELNDSLVLPALPLPLIPILPGITQKFTITDRATIQKLKELQTRDNVIGLFLQKNPPNRFTSIINDIDEIYKVGTCAEFRDLRLTGNSADFVVSGLTRIRIESLVEKGPPMIVKASKYPQAADNLDELTIRALSNELFSYVETITAQSPIHKHYFMSYEKEFPTTRDPLYLTNFAGYMTFCNREDLQKLLEANSSNDRFDLAVKIFSQELQAMQVQKDLKSRVEKTSKENERNYILREQMKAIQKELGGDKDPKQKYIDMVNKKLEEMKRDEVSPAAITAVEEELQRLTFTDIQHAEFEMTQNYINWVINLPWKHQSEDQMNIAWARQVLNDDHYGLKDVKDRILEFIAVGKLQGHIPGKVLCFVGPPGTGKTSIAKSIARALGREYCQFSVGGANDVAQIKGHRRTYVGSLPGKLIWCMKNTKVNNPLILIDEVDKISSSRNGDPASALLEVLDPNQNKEFLDTYLDIPFDFSKVLFICTANDLSTIPQPLLDRMEVIRVSGYDYQEKLEISKRYLDKKARIATGLEPDRVTTPKSLTIADDALQSIIRWYCREAGVRNLEKSIEKIYRKVAMRLATMTPAEIESTDFTIHEGDLEQYIGKRIFLSDRLYETTPPGVVMGLAWTSMGGATLYIECQTVKTHPLDVTLSSRREADATDKENDQDKNKEKEKVSADKAVQGGHLTMTGQLGDVMKESIQIAYLNARHWMQRLSFSDTLYDSLIRDYVAHKPEHPTTPTRDQVFNILETSDLHMHLPEGATPKDGPSAGCAITTSLLSIALNRPIKQGLAMTGEISLNGKVLPVGGIKEKVMAARRAGVNEIILPEENCRDVNELPEYIKENLTIHYASTYENVLRYTDLCPEAFQ